MIKPLVALSAALLAVPALAQEPLPRTERSLLQPQQETALAPTGLDKSKLLTGDWGGFRQGLYDRGVDVFGFYNTIVSGNVIGGRSPRNATYDHDIWVGFKFDLEKLYGWGGAQFVISGINRDGDDLTSKYIGSVYSAQQLVGGQRTFLYQVYLQQKFLDDQWTAKIGRFGASDDFNTSPLYGYSLNNGIDGNIRNVLFNTRFSAYPFATWAAALFYDPTTEWHAKLGVFQVSEGEFENDDNGLNFGIGDRDGYLAIFQFGWTPEFGKTAPRGDGKSLEPALKGRPGHYWLGATFSQWDLYPRFDGGTEDVSYGFYAHADQMLTQESAGSEEGLTVFLAAAYYPQTEISIVPFQVNAGLNYKGLFPGRGEDHSMLHFIYGNLSDDYARSVRVPNGSDPESEQIVEVAHRFQITPWSYFQPDLQWIIHPGGTGDIPDAMVIGAQMGLTF